MKPTRQLAASACCLSLLPWDPNPTSSKSLHIVSNNNNLEARISQGKGGAKRIGVTNRTKRSGISSICGGYYHRTLSYCPTRGHHCEISRKYDHFEDVCRQSSRSVTERTRQQPVSRDALNRTKIPSPRSIFSTATHQRKNTIFSLTRSRPSTNRLTPA